MAQAQAVQRVLMLDNYDSFTFNIVQYLSELNAEVVTYRNDEITLEQMRALADDGLNTFYVVPPILRGGRRDYAAVRQALEEFSR